MTLKNRLFRLFCSIGLCLLTACSHAYQTHQQTRQSYRPHSDTLHIDVALDQIGTPYRYGGNNPSGFDCSGLVQYAYSRAGRDIPRNTTAQYRYADKIRYSELQEGDLVFFHIPRVKNKHVGIYIGDGEFVHAPSSGKRVKISSMHNPYWQKYFLSAARIPDRQSNN